MKRTITTLLIFALLLTLSAAALSPGETSVPTLSELSDQKILAFLAANDVRIPPELTDNPYLLTFVRNIIAEVEENPQTQFLYSYTVMQTFAEEIKVAVNSYYGTNIAILPMATYATFAEAVAQLQQNTSLAQNWLSSYEKQNSYGYAIGRTAYVDPGYYYDDTVLYNGMICYIIYADPEAG